MLGFIELPVAVAEAEARGLQLPTRNPDGSYVLMTSTWSTHPDYLTAPEFQRFIEVASRPGSRVLEIGAAYGHTCAEVIRQRQAGGTHSLDGEFVVNDMERQHLLVAARELSSMLGGGSSYAIRLLEGFFPDQVMDVLEPSSFDAILASHVLGLGSSTDLIHSFDAFGRLLRPGGVLCIRGGSPHVGYLREDVRAGIERRSEEFANAPPRVQEQAMREVESGSNPAALPGFVENVKDGLEPGLLTSFGVADVEKVGFQKPYDVFFDARTVEWLAVNRAELAVDHCGYLPMSSKATDGLWKVTPLDGREILSLVATKPKAE